MKNSPGPRLEKIQRLQKTLETAGIKLDSVVSDITGMPSTAMIEALIDGERRGAALADLAQGRPADPGQHGGPVHGPGLLGPTTMP